ncbi:tyrosine-type recombinase/integrase [Shewanella aestuarii]|uniref:Tyrosine-type recombinase/integrase n=1 Tax=Shewanella aestuarii TaxID=1028752 RepID=A0A6G9QPT7_9GAMM|nr:tyrosine-type recombinase/integrase [Shewanella aestuarii]QIR16576.1 tyrosine-type recombinase/integrase [Shewanella aestuarii]
MQLNRVTANIKPLIFNEFGTLMNTIAKYKGKVTLKNEADYFFEDEMPPSFNQFADSVEALLNNTRASKTIETYEDNIKPFYEFCAANGVQAIPADPRTVAIFISYQANHCVSQYGKALSVNTIATRIAAIRYFHIKSGLPSPTDHQICIDTFDGLKRVRDRQTQDTRQDPILYPDIESLLEAIGPDDTLKAVRDKAILTLGLQGGFRRSELCALKVNDLSFRRNALRIDIKFSKANQKNKLEWKELPIDEPFAAYPFVQRWLAYSGITGGHLFRSISRDKQTIRTYEEDIAAGKVNGILSGNDIYRMIKQYSVAAGLQASRIGAHSLRSGCVTQLAENDKTDLYIMGRTGHQDPRTLQNYIKRKD